MNKVSFLSHLLCLIIVMFLGNQNLLVAQKYLGIGVHYGKPVAFDNCCNSLFQAKPFLAPSFSISFKKEIISKKKKKWYHEVGLTTAAIGYKKIEHENDTLHIAPWGVFKELHIGFPSLFYAFGRSFPVRENHEFLLGIEASKRLLYTLSGSYSRAFTLDGIIGDAKFPFYLRANIGYKLPLKLVSQIPAHLLFYSKISAQNIAKGKQFISDPITGIIKEGEYSLNNSEVGIQLYVDIGKEHYNFLDKPKKERKPREKRTGKAKVKLSIEHQIFALRHTKYYMPLEADSFTLSGGNFNATSQIGLKVEFVHFKNPDWSTIVAVGTGRINEFRHFSISSAFSPTGKGFDGGAGQEIGRFLIQNVGLTYKHDLGKKRLQHSFSVCAVEPIERYASGYDLTLNPGSYMVLKGDFQERYGHDKLLIGVEYSPQLLLHTHKRVYFGLGMTFNITKGYLAIGRASVTNGRTTYYGGMLQGFSKIGITASMGFQGRRSVLDN